MPIVEIERVARPGEVPEAGLSGRLAKACAAVFKVERGRTWVRYRELESTGYAEDGEVPGELAPVFVQVLLARWPPQSERADLALRLADVIATECERPAENVHVLFLPAGAGRIAFGGLLMPEEE